jgi:hypothetical protein
MKSCIFNPLPVNTGFIAIDFSQHAKKINQKALACLN